jgi:hypothetical protein
MVDDLAMTWTATMAGLPVERKLDTTSGIKSRQ